MTSKHLARRLERLKPKSCRERKRLLQRSWRCVNFLVEAAHNLAVRCLRLEFEQNRLRQAEDGGTLEAFTPPLNELRQNARHLAEFA